MVKKKQLPYRPKSASYLLGDERVAVSFNPIFIWYHILAMERYCKRHF